MTRRSSFVIHSSKYSSSSHLQHISPAPTRGARAPAPPTRPCHPPPSSSSVGTASSVCPCPLPSHQFPADPAPGSAICRTAVSRSWTVHSLSSSGRPYATPSGHTPRWAQSVTWHAADAFQPAAYAPLLAGADAVVHTLGILLEDPGYKGAVKEGDVWSLARAFWGGLAGTGGATNPLRSAEDKRGGYEGMNRDSGAYLRWPPGG